MTFYKQKNRTTLKATVTIVLFTLFFGISGNSQENQLIAKGARLELIADGFKFTEGPISDSAGNVYFTDQPNNRIHKWNVEDNSVQVFLEDAGRANGLYFDPKGNLYAAADNHSEIWKIDPHKNITTIVNGFKGNRLNGPNDIWIAPNGSLYFTDPFYKRPYWTHDERPLKKQRVYFLSPDGRELKIAAGDLVKPNGIIGTADGEHLFIADIEDNKTWKYSIKSGGSLHKKTLFTNLGSDGMTMDEQGNIYLTGGGVTVFNQLGEKILHIPVDKEWTANVTFGGKDNRTLFITAMDSVFKLEMNVAGAR